MADRNRSTLAFINDEGYLRFKDKTVNVHDVVRDVLYVSMLSSGKEVRIAFFYQNDSFDAVIPYCLEMLYQLKGINSNRNCVLLYGGKLYSYFKSVYKNTYFGDGNFCNDLFGLGCIRPEGGIRSEKKYIPPGLNL